MSLVAGREAGETDARYMEALAKALPAAINRDGRADSLVTGVDLNRNGIPDVLERPVATVPVVPMATVGLDVDRDGRADYLVKGVDLNRDGIPDVLERPVATVPVVPMATVGLDVDRDGRADYLVKGVDLNRDGIPDALEQTVQVPVRPVAVVQVPAQAAVQVQTQPVAVKRVVQAPAAVVKPVVQPAVVKQVVQPAVVKQVVQPAVVKKVVQAAPVQLVRRVQATPLLLQAPAAEAQVMMYDPTMMETGAPSWEIQPFKSKRRRSLNACAMALAVFLPWATFVVVSAALSFKARYTSPFGCWVIVVLCLLPALYCLAARCGADRTAAETGLREPSWMLFLFVSLMLAWIAGIIFADETYIGYSRPYFEMQDLNVYDLVSPESPGERLEDAGRLNLLWGSRVDQGRSASFSNTDKYCVAPIVPGPGTVRTTFDLWAVGKNCCDMQANQFSCGSSSQSQKAPTALRAMSDHDRAFYRLAVQQAEAARALKAPHPIFLEWVEDAGAIVDGWRTTAVSRFAQAACFCLLAQAFLVAVATLHFSKIPL